MTAATGGAVTTVERVPSVGSRRTVAAAAAALATGHLALAVAAAVPSPVGFAVAAAAVAAVELVLPRRVPVLPWALARVGAGMATRGLVRGLLLTLLAARAGGGAVLVGATVAVLALLVLRLARAGLVQLVGYLRTPPLLSRGLPLTDVVVPPAPPQWALDPGGLAALTDLVAAAAVAATAAGAPYAVAAVGLAVAVTATAVPAALLLAVALRLHRADTRRGMVRALHRRLAELRPRVLLYFAGSPGSRYQLESWLGPVERLGVPALVLVRDRDVLAALAPTRLPVLCVPHGSTLMALDLPDARVGLYVANASGNIHLLRRRGVASVFVGHGDSDKGASASPFTRVYDEVWVAGPAGRARYLAADVGVADADVVEVGRPQLAELPPPGPRRQRVGTTVLYAPTWEGWGDEPHHSSLPHLGPALVAALLATPGVRVLYRPHPLTGSRDSTARRGHREVLRLLAGAGAAGPGSAPPPPAAESAAGGDLLDLARNSGAAPTAAADRARAAAGAWTAAYWAAAPGRHRVLTPPAPDLFACFAETDVLIADVSSVVSDFLALDRPYAVLDPAGLGAAEFAHRYPSSRGGFLLDPGLTALPDLLAAADGADPTAPARRALRAELLGPPNPDPAARFRAAVDRLVTASRPAASVLEKRL